MAYEVTIGGDGTLFVGEDKTFRLELVDTQDPPQPIDMTNWNMVFDVRVKDTSTDAIVSEIPVLAGVFSGNRALNQQRAYVFLSDTLMNLFRAKTYRWSWKRLDDGSETVLAWGNFAPQKATAP
jgi:hypothetical protein